MNKTDVRMSRARPMDKFLFLLGPGGSPSKAWRKERERETLCIEVRNTHAWMAVLVFIYF
jgi:hypothetical protein